MAPGPHPKTGSAPIQTQPAWAPPLGGGHVPPVQNSGGKSLRNIFLTYKNRFVKFFKIKRPKSEEKSELGVGGFDGPESVPLPSQNFVAAPLAAGATPGHDPSARVRTGPGIGHIGVGAQPRNEVAEIRGGKNGGKGFLLMPRCALLFRFSPSPIQKYLAPPLLYWDDPTYKKRLSMLSWKGNWKFSLQRHYAPYFDIPTRNTSKTLGH